MRREHRELLRMIKHTGGRRGPYHRKASKGAASKAIRPAKRAQVSRGHPRPRDRSEGPRDAAAQTRQPEPEPGRADPSPSQQRTGRAMMSKKPTVHEDEEAYTGPAKGGPQPLAVDDDEALAAAAQWLRDHTVCARFVTPEIVQFLQGMIEAGFTITYTPPPDVPVEP